MGVFDFAGHSVAGCSSCATSSLDGPNPGHAQAEHELGGWLEDAANAATGPLGWATKPFSDAPATPTAASAPKAAPLAPGEMRTGQPASGEVKAGASTSVLETAKGVADAAIGPLAWGAKAAEEAAKAHSESIGEVGSTARTIRYGAYAAAGIAAVAAVGYLASGVGKVLRG